MLREELMNGKQWLVDRKRGSRLSHPGPMIRQSHNFVRDLGSPGIGVSLCISSYTT